MAPPRHELLESDLDAAEDKRRRRQRFHVQMVPRLRLFGGLLFIGLAWIHNVVVFGDPRWDLLRLLVVIGVTYVIGSWVVLRLYFERVRTFNLGDFFLGTDLLLYALAIYASGGTRACSSS
tara:strand:- start:308 stop:670 length:363 start_codon:yes stop_codon:yes gene_type:complete